MDRKSSIEAGILSRSYNEQEAQQLLSTRFYVNSGGKEAQGTLLLMPTATKPPKKQKLQLDQKTTVEHEKYHVLNKNSRKAFKDWVAEVRTAQKECIRQLAKLCQEHGITDFENDADKVNELLQSVPEYQKIPQYDDFAQLNELWVKYIKDMLSIATAKDASKLSLGNATLKLASADYNGCEFQVTKSRTSTYIDTKGICIWDGRKTFFIVVPRVTNRGLRGFIGGMKIVEKRGSTFTFHIPVNDTEALEYSILGSRFVYKAAERSGRKFKSHPVDDL